MEALVTKLIKIQQDLKAPKGQYNSFGKYNYRSAEDILEAVKPINAANGLLLTLSDEPQIIGEYQYIKATATISDGKDTHSVTAYARESLNKKGMDESQITGTASSYARKYALNGLYLIDDTKDADTDEHRQQGEKKQSGAPNNQEGNTDSNLITPAQIKMLGAKTKAVAKVNEQDPAAVYKSAASHLGIDKQSKDLTKSEASKMIDYLAKLEG